MGSFHNVVEFTHLFEQSSIIIRSTGLFAHYLWHHLILVNGKGSSVMESVGHHALMLSSRPFHKELRSNLNLTYSAVVPLKSNIRLSVTFYETEPRTENFRCE